MTQGQTQKPEIQQRPESIETQDIVRRYESRKNLYPDIKTAEDINNKSFTDLIGPLEKNAGNLPKTADTFLKQVKALEDSFKGIADKNKLHQYLNELLKNENEEAYEKAINNSTIIKKEDVHGQKFEQLKAMRLEYQKYQEWLEKQIKLEVTLKKEKETVLSKPIEYAKSSENWVAGNIQKFRENFAAMDGKEKTIAGLTLLVGFAMIFNSKNPQMAEMRKMLGKVAMLGVGYVALNTTSKAFLGKSVSDIVKSRMDDKSGKRDFLKDSFKTDKDGAEIMNAALINLGDYDFDELAKHYLMAEEKYKQTPIRDEMKELHIGGVAQDNMSPHQIYVAMRMLDRKLQREGSSIKEIQQAFEKRRKEEERKGKPFPRPTFGLILAAVLEKDIFKYKINKGKIEKVESSDVKFDSTQKSQTSGWWVAMGAPAAWKAQAYNDNAFPKDRVSEDNLKTITEDKISINKPLGNVVTEANFGRFTRGFKLLCDTQYQLRPNEKINTLKDDSDNSLLITSKVDIDYEAFKHPKTKNDARVAAAMNAREQAIKEIKTRPEFKKLSPDVLNRIHEFIQPVYGVYLAEPEKGGLGSPKKYVQFLRVALPASVEFKLRENNEWTDGDMMQMKKVEPMKAGDSLTRNDFQVLSSPTSAMRISYKPGKEWYETILGKFGLMKSDKSLKEIELNFESYFGGCYEAFLVKFGLRKDETAKIDKVLEYYSKEYAGKGITKAGLVRYLASHEFSTKEVKTALGDMMNPLIDLSLESQIKKATMDVVKGNSGTSYADIMSGFGNMFILACYGDKKATAAVMKIYDKKDFAAALTAVVIMPPIPASPAVSPKQLLLTNKLIPAYKEIIKTKSLHKQIESEVEDFRKV